MSIPHMTNVQQSMGDPQGEVGGEFLVQPDFTLLLSILMEADANNSKTPPTDNEGLVCQVDTTSNAPLPEILMQAAVEQVDEEFETKDMQLDAKAAVKDEVAHVDAVEDKDVTGDAKYPREDEQVHLQTQDFGYQAYVPIGKVESEPKPETTTNPHKRMGSEPSSVVNREEQIFAPKLEPGPSVKQENLLQSEDDGAHIQNDFGFRQTKGEQYSIQTRAQANNLATSTNQTEGAADRLLQETMPDLADNLEFLQVEDSKHVPITKEVFQNIEKVSSHSQDRLTSPMPSQAFYQGKIADSPPPIVKLPEVGQEAQVSELQVAGDVEKLKNNEHNADISYKNFSTDKASVQNAERGYGNLATRLEQNTYQDGQYRATRPRDDFGDGRRAEPESIVSMNWEPSLAARPTFTNSTTEEVVDALHSPLDLEQTGEIAPKLAERMQASFTAERSEVRIDLKPEHLGELKIRVAVEQGVVSAEFIAESQMVKEVLQANFPNLRSCLQEQGVQVSDLAVNVGTTGDQESQDKPTGRTDYKQANSTAKVKQTAAKETLINTGSWHNPNQLGHIDLKV